MEDSNQPVTSAQSTATQQMGSYVSREFVQAREGCWVPLTDKQLVYIGCGDDRALTSASADALAAEAPAEVLDPAQGYASIFGATAGLAKNVLVVGAAQFGAGFVTAVGGFDGAMKLLVQNSKNLQTLHSAESNEQNSRHFSFTSAVPVGCAYAAGVGATSALLVESTSIIRDVAKADQKYIFGSDKGFDELLRGHQAFLDYATAQEGANFAVDRNHYERYKQEFGNRLHFMILAGNHAKAKTSGVISNFSLTQIGSSVKAHQNKHDFYRLDIAIATDMILQALSGPLAAINPDYTLSPELLMRAFLLDATPVRAVLASHDTDAELQGNIDPRNLRLGVRGNQFESLKTLRERQARGDYTRS